MIVVIGGIKGGSGKTTIATNLTVMRSNAGKKVLLVDADDQRSSSDWAMQRESQDIPTPWTTVNLKDESVGIQINKMRHDYDDIIVDTGGRDTGSQRSALVRADVFIAPFQPRSLDIWTISKVRKILNEVYIVNPDLKSYVLINRADSIGNDNKDTMEVLEGFSELACLPFMIGQRKAFSNAAADGMGVIEMKNPDKKAISEIEKLYEYLYV